MVFYTNKFVKDGFAGITYGPFIFIRSEYRKDIGLLEHEKVHRMQWICTLGLHSILYNLIPWYRFKAECQAYRKQLKYYPNKVNSFALFLTERYNLDISYEEALKELSKK